MARSWHEWLVPAAAESFEWDTSITPFASIAWPVGGAAVYFAVIASLVSWRAGKPALDVQAFTRVHNLVLVVLSVTLSYGVWSEVARFYAKWLAVNRALMDRTGAEVHWYELYLAPWYSLCCHQWCSMQPYVHENVAAGKLNNETAEALCPHTTNPVSGPLYWWLYLTYIFKFYDMIDTVLLALKGSLRWENVHNYFLHLFHHATVPLCAWMGFQGRLLMPLWMGMGINNVVHGTMYSYYFLRSIGYQPWWRRYLTLLQTSQFALGAVMTVYGCFHFFKDPKVSAAAGFTYTRGCDAEAGYIFSCAWFNLAFLFLFLDWYRREYRGKNTTKVASDKQGVNTCTPDVSKPLKVD